MAQQPQRVAHNQTMHAQPNHANKVCSLCTQASSLFHTLASSTCAINLNWQGHAYAPQAMHHQLPKIPQLAHQFVRCVMLNIPFWLGNVCRMPMHC